MFGNMPALDNSENDRVRRTCDRLGSAMRALLVEKPFDDITVQNVLERAGVSRSTFYTHYRDKNDLFLSDAEEFFEMMATALSRGGENSDRVAPVRELFAHIAQVRPFYDALIASGRSDDLLQLAQGHFARGIEQRFRELSRSATIPQHHRRAVAHALAGSMFSLLTWWVHHNMPSSTQEMDELFHQLVWTGVSPPRG
jgi:AcrR family transcriptional regulator